MTRTFALAALLAALAGAPTDVYADGSCAVQAAAKTSFTAKWVKDATRN